MHIDLTQTVDFEKSLEAVRTLAISGEAYTNFHLTLSAAQVYSLGLVNDYTQPATEPDTPAPASVEITVETNTSEDVQSATEPAKPKRFRKTKAETEAGLTLDQAKAFRASGMLLEEYVASLSDTPAEETPVELDDTPPEPKAAVKTAATLEDQPAMSSPPTGVDREQFLDQIRTHVTCLVKEHKMRDAVKVYTQKLGLGKLSDAPTGDLPAIVKYLGDMIPGAATSDDDLV